MLPSMPDAAEVTDGAVAGDSTSCIMQKFANARQCGQRALRPARQSQAGSTRIYGEHTCIGRSGYFAASAGIKRPHAVVLSRSGNCAGSVASVIVADMAPLVADTHLQARATR